MPSKHARRAHHRGKQRPAKRLTRRRRPGKPLHVVYHSTEKRWNVMQSGKVRARGFTHQQYAVELGRRLARRERLELVIHARDGKIRDSDSYGNDPKRPRDKVH